MFTSDAIHPVSEFSRKPGDYIKRLKETGKPELLTVNGKAELVIQDAKAYEEMVTLLSTLEKTALAAKAHDEGKALPAQEAFAALNKRLADRSMPIYEVRIPEIEGCTVQILHVKHGRMERRPLD